LGWEKFQEKIGGWFFFGLELIGGLFHQLENFQILGPGLGLA